jgi:amidase
LPQVSLPFASLNGCPLGLSLIAARGNDEMLLALAVRLQQERNRSHA